MSCPLGNPELLADERADAKPDWQLAPILELDECLEHFLVDALGGFVRPYVLAPEKLTNAEDSAGKPPRP